MSDITSQLDGQQPLSVELGRSGRPRKSVRIKPLIEHINRRLADPDLGFEARVELSLFAEQLLHAASVYIGFSYNQTEWEQVTSTGLRRLRKGYDEFRRHYHVSKTLS